MAVSKLIHLSLLVGLAVSFNLKSPAPEKPFNEGLEPRPQLDKDSTPSSHVSLSKVLYTKSNAGENLHSKSQFADARSRLSNTLDYKSNTKEGEREASRHCRMVSENSANCSSLELTSVPNNLTVNLVSLDLSNNLIRSLPAWAFRRYPKLEVLVLTENRIGALSSDCFTKLSRLKRLHLDRNSLEMNETIFSPSLFLPLSSLEYLNIGGNNPDLDKPGLTYPDKALSSLTRLKELSMDGLQNQALKSGLKHLSLLKTLTFGGCVLCYCKLDTLSANMFVNTPSLSALSLSECGIKDMSPSVFLPLLSLQYLDLSSNENLLLHNFTSAMAGLKHSNLTHLKIDNIMTIYSPAIHVKADIVKSFPRTLRKLEARYNSIESISKEAFMNMPANLEYLDVSGNRFIFGKYLRELHQLKNLKTLMVGGGSITKDIPKKYPVFQDERTSELQAVAMATENSGPVSFSFRREAAHEDSSSNLKFVLRLPPETTSINMTYFGLHYTVSELRVNSNNNLQELLLMGNKFPKLIGPVYGLSNLKTLNMNLCFITFISSSFFQEFANLETLLLHGNMLGYTVVEKSLEISVFRWLLNLRIFDLSFSYIRNVQKNLFENMTKLQEINFSKNPMYYFTADISMMFDIKQMDFSYTELTRLTKEQIQHLNNISNKNITIDFSETPIHCYCADLDFIKWVVNSAIFKSPLKDYKCVYLDTSEKYITDFADTLKSLEKQCASNALLFGLVTTSTCIILVFIIASLAYRFRWKLRYVYYSAYLRLRGEEKEHAKDSNFETDVFISYAHEDESFIMDTLYPNLQQRGIRSFVHGRDFMAGEYISSNILQAIQRSRKTLVVLSRALLDSYWCNYELQMANMESVQTGRSVLVFLMMENIDKQEMSSWLLYHIQNNTYASFPSLQVLERLDEQTAQKTMSKFWDKLISDLRR